MCGKVSQIVDKICLRSCLINQALTNRIAIELSIEIDIPHPLRRAVI